MNILTRIIPDYLCEKYNLIKMIVFTAIYALIFINIYQPFGLGAWVEDKSSLYYLIYSTLVVTIGFIVIALSRVVMYFWHQRQKLMYIQYWTWILVEILFMSIFFTIIIISIKTNTNAITVFKDAFFGTILILLIPYWISFMFFSWVEKNRIIEERDEILPIDKGTRMIDFYDERQQLRLSVMKTNLLYIEAADNYVCIFYKKKNGISRFMLRNTLKTMETYLADVHIVRCHRSYMVNLEHVSVIRRQREGIFLEINDPDVRDIPLSPRYLDKVNNWFKSTDREA